MKFKIVGKSLILTDYSHKITEGENLYDTVEIVVPKKHDDCDLSVLSFRFSETSADGGNSAVQILCQEKCDEKYIYLKGAITSDFSAITGKVTFTLTGINAENVVAKFQSEPFTVSDDINLDSLPNDMTAEQIYNQTHLEAEKAIEAAKRAEMASQTPAPVEIYPATTERLGSVKVDGKTITASKDGIISANEVQNLAVQIAHPNNYLIYDDLGKPSVMVAIPKFFLDEVINGAPHTVHPAFVVNGIEQDVIYISKYQNVIENNRAYSLPMKVPQTGINFDQAWNYCKNKGSGWHLMTNAEWAAIALWCKKNNTMPHGNNNYGKDINELSLPRKATLISNIYTATGSGRESWYHDDTFAGISDLNGNIWEWVSGLRLVDGEIQIIENNNTADWNNLCSESSTLWKAILSDGTLVSPQTSSSLKFDYTTKPSEATEGICITTALKNQQSNSAPYGYNKFGELTTDSTLTVPPILKALALFPADTAGYNEEKIWIKNRGEQLPVRGGHWSRMGDCGIFAMHISDTRSYTYGGLGFRCAYYAAE